MTRCRSSYRSTLRTSWTWVSNPVSGVARCTRSAWPVSDGVNTSCPRALGSPSARLLLSDKPRARLRPDTPSGDDGRHEVGDPSARVIGKPVDSCASQATSGVPAGLHQPRQRLPILPTHAPHVTARRGAFTDDQVEPAIRDRALALPSSPSVTVTGRCGLLSGEALRLEPKRMELAPYEDNQRQFEITRHVSLRQLDQVALVSLKVTGSCTLRTS